MAWIMNQYDKYHGFNPGVVTGKPVEYYGIPGREEATGRGVGLADAQDCSAGWAASRRSAGRHSRLRQRRLARGQVSCTRPSARSSAISDSSGGYYRADGLDVLGAHATTRSNNELLLDGFRDAEQITNERAAGTRRRRADSRGARRRDHRRRTLGAHQGADHHRSRQRAGATRGRRDPRSSAATIVLPDILANAGGVTVSYFEWVQNRQYYHWNLNRVRQELDKTLTHGVRGDVGLRAKRKVSLRTAAFMLGIDRVARAATLGGIS